MTTVPALTGPVLPALRLTWPHVLASEARRLRTLRSTWWFTAILVLLVGLFGTFPAIGVAVGALDVPPEESGPLGGALGGIQAAGILVTAFGVLAASAEYATGMMAATFTAVPRRGTVVLARAAVVGAVVLPVSLVLTFGTFGVVRLLLGPAGAAPPLTTDVALALTGAAVGLAVLAVLGVAAGWLLRSTAGGITAVVVVVHMLPAIGLVVPAAVADRVLPWLPGNALGAITTPGHVQGMPPQWASLAALVGYVGAALALAAAVVRRRDV